MTQTSRISSLLLGGLLFVALGQAQQAKAQEPLPAVLPTVLFLVEESDAMGDPWAGDPTLTSPDTRWNYVKEAIKQIVQNAPVGMDIGVALTSNLIGVELSGFEMLAYPGMGASATATALDLHPFIGGGPLGLVTWATSYANVLDNWAENPALPIKSWLGGPFDYYCSSLVVITVGMSTGELDGLANPSFRQVPPGNVMCNDTQLIPTQGCFLDDVAYYANNSFSPIPLTSSGAVTTYSMLVDSLVADPAAANLLNNTAVAGNGMALDAATPAQLAVGFWQMLTDTFGGEYSNAAVSMSPNGDLLLASYYEVNAGWPLYKGHLLAWDVDNNPNSASYGEIIPAAPAPQYPWRSANGAAWDGGYILASRQADPGETNQNSTSPSFLQSNQRNGYTEDANQGMYTSMMPFDSTELTAGGDLTTLLIDEVPLSANQACNPLPHDFDYDCDADVDDAQLLVDFLRGVDEAIFLGTALRRDSDGSRWKMGDTGHSTAVVAPAQITAIALEAHFRAYRQKLQSLPSVTYVASNAGQIHAFDMEGLVSNYSAGGSELWFYFPRAKLDKDPDAGSKEFDGFQGDDLFRSGQTYVNDGRLSLDHVWLDGYVNDLTGCSGPGYVSAQDDGVIEPNGCEWHRVLTWSGGYGSRHHYAIDVTNPLNPRFLWERTDQGNTTYTGKGRAVGRPLVSSFWDGSGSPERRWIAFWGAGAQPPGGIPGASQAHAGVYIHDMDTTILAPTQYQTQGYSLNHPGAGVTDIDGDGFEEYPSTEPGLFGTPAGADLDGDGSIDVAYIGDSMGYMFKVAFNQVTPNSPQTCLFSAPASGDAARHIYYEPAIFYGQSGELLVYWGTGSPFNIYDTSVGGVYAKVDPNPYNCTSNGSTSPQGQAAPCASSSALFDSTGFYQFGAGGAVGEKIVGRPTVRAGRMFFATHIPGSDPCVLGSSRLYGLDVETCGGGLFDDTSDSYSVTSNLYTEVPGLISEPVFANGQLYALQIDGGPIDGNSPIDDFSVTPDNFTEFVYVSHRHVF